MNARINWEVPWAQVPARDKAKLFEVVSAYNYIIRLGVDESGALTILNHPGARSASILGTI